MARIFKGLRPCNQTIKIAQYSYVKFPAPLLVRGVATYAWEVFKEISDLDAVYVPIGLVRRLWRNSSSRFTGFEDRNYWCFMKMLSIFLVFRSGRLISTNSADTIADGLACRVPNNATLDIMKKGVSRIVEVKVK